MPMHPIPILCHKTINFPTCSGKLVKKTHEITIPKIINKIEVMKISSSRLAVFSSSLVNSSEKS